LKPLNRHDFPFKVAQKSFHFHWNFQSFTKIVLLSLKFSNHHNFLFKVSQESFHFYWNFQIFTTFISKFHKIRFTSIETFNVLPQLFCFYWNFQIITIFSSEFHKNRFTYIKFFKSSRFLFQSFTKIVSISLKLWNWHNFLLHCLSRIWQFVINCVSIVSILVKPQGNVSARIQKINSKSWQYWITNFCQFFTFQQINFQRVLWRSTQYQHNWQQKSFVSWGTTISHQHYHQHYPIRS
jgi:hypothetical protein